MTIRHGLFGALGALAARHLVRKRAFVAGDHPEWERTNYRGKTVSLAGGVTTATTLAAAALPTACVSPHVGIAQLVTAGAGGAFGYRDDRESSTDSAKGLAGHLGALSRGEVTTGAMKIVGIGAAAGVAAIALARRRAQGSLLDVGIDTVLIASSANLINLLDLRPGRAFKVTLIGALPFAFGEGAGAVCAGGLVATCAAQMRDDLEERHMLGDTGANAAGGVLGACAAASLGRRGRLLGAATCVAAMLASEKVSFSQVIDSTPPLRLLDNLGRRTDA